MRDLTPEAEEILVKYYLEPGNTWLALAIGQVLPKLRKAIVSSFVNELDECVKIEIEERRLHRRWETEIPETNLESRGGDNLYLISMEDPKIEICLFYEGRELAIGIFARNKDFPPANVLEEYLPDLPLKSSSYWSWWFCPEPEHKSFDSLITVHDDDLLRREKIEYFTEILVGLAEAISRALEYPNISGKY